MSAVLLSDLTDILRRIDSHGKEQIPGQLPGHRHPAHHRRPPRRAEGAREPGGPDHEHGQVRREAVRGEPALLQRRAREGGHRRYHHRPRGRGRRLRGEVPPRGRRHHPDRDPLLVLRLRDHGHGPQHHQGRLGLQRHRAPRRGVPGLRAGHPRPEGPARLRHLRP